MCIERFSRSNFAKNINLRYIKKDTYRMERVDRNLFSVANGKSFILKCKRISNLVFGASE
jgi:hypothetical protein